MNSSANSSTNSSANPWPTELRLRKDRKTLTVVFDDGATFDLAAEYVEILEVHPVGNYAVRLVFDDMHSTGIFSWDYLFELGHNREDNWRRYLADLAAKNLSRAPPTH